jgi:hypothetical protein
MSTWSVAINRHWDEVLSAQGKEFRVEEQALEQSTKASLPALEWRIPYGVDGPEAREMANEIEHRRAHGISLAGLAWPPSEDPYSPANDPNHPYYLDGVNKL